jgi:hypothetical protein
MFIAAYNKKIHCRPKTGHGTWTTLIILIIDHVEVVLGHKVFSSFKHTIYKCVPLFIFFKGIVFMKQLWVKVRTLVLPPTTSFLH